MNGDLLRALGLLLLTASAACYRGAPPPPEPIPAVVEAPRWKLDLAVHSALEAFGVPVAEVDSAAGVIRSGSFLVKGRWGPGPRGHPGRLLQGRAAPADPARG